MGVLTAGAQRFYNLTAGEVRTDSVLPLFSHTEPLGGAWRDSTYRFEIAYAEYVDMPQGDVQRYMRLHPEPTPAQPQPSADIVLDRKRPHLSTAFCPVVLRGGRYQVLASFMLRRIAEPKGGVDASAQTRVARQTSSGTTPAARYAASSVLSTGRWAKIRVPSTGIYALTDALVRRAGFSSLAHVRVYGSGGNLRSEVLDGDELAADDDLHEVPTYQAGAQRLFYAHGPVSWTESSTVRTRNPYSDYGYYFITETDGQPLVTDSAAFVGSFYPSPDWSNDLYEVDAYAYARVGRNLYDSHAVAQGETQQIELQAPEAGCAGRLSVGITSAGATRVEVLFNGSVCGTLATTVSEASYRKGFAASGVYSIECGGQAAQTVELRVTGGAAMRLDYVSAAWDRPHALPQLASGTFPVPEYVYNITNQNHHADPQADMVIIIPTSQKLKAQAQRLKAFHEQRDGMRVNVVPADELYNEFTSGTPDASAYRRYLKMLYDRAESEADQPKYLVLFGPSVWDNRMLTADCSRLTADDYLLAFESEESFDLRTAYVDDGFFALLDDGEGARPLQADKMDVAVGRFPVATAEEAKIMVDKTLAYPDNLGPWLNNVMIMGDDGDNNTHMIDANRVADWIVDNHPAYRVRKMMWDAYQRVPTATGNTYPDVAAAIKQQQKQGALLMNYVGHGSEVQLAGENVLMLSDFQNFANTNMPLWATFACDVMPFDRLADNIGMAALLNAKGGAVAVVGTTRTVISTYNAMLNRAFTRHLFTPDTDGRPVPVGEALRRAKNETTDRRLAINSMEYVLCGDPALRLNMPTARIVIDSICGTDVASGDAMPQMKAGALVSVAGHVDADEPFDGEVTLTVMDNITTVTCRDNTDDADSLFKYTDRTNIIYSGRNAVSGGRFAFKFAVPKDINYSDLPGLVTAWAVAADGSAIAQGYSQRFTVGGDQLADADSIGPSVYCYLNSPSFQNGGRVNSTPFFVAELTDRSGINAAGAGIGHDMQLVIDGKAEMTYSLNDNFAFDFGSYTSGSTYYNIPELDEGEHTLVFRAWDIYNNMTATALRFSVARGLKPTFSISCTDNPARESTTFIIAHDRTGSLVDVGIDVFDMSGRQLWRHDESGVSTDAVYTVPWNLRLDNGARLDTGIYLYRVRLGSDGASRTSKAKKLVVVGNK